MPLLREERRRLTTGPAVAVAVTAALSLGLPGAFASPVPRSMKAEVAQAANAGTTGPLSVFLTVPGLSGESKNLQAAEELSAFSLSTTASASPLGSSKASPKTTGVAMATMHIDAFSVGLLSDLSAPLGSQKQVKVMFYRGGGPGQAPLGPSTGPFLTYAFAGVLFSSYLLQDGPTGASVEVDFTYGRLQVAYTGSKQGTYSLGSVRAG